MFKNSLFVIQSLYNACINTHECFGQPSKPIEKLYIDLSFYEKSLNTVLDNTAILNTLDIYGYCYDADALDPRMARAANIEQNPKLRQCTKSLLSKIRYNSDTIKGLVLYSCSYCHRVNNNLAELIYLENLNIESSNINSNSLMLLIHKSPNLKKLRLAGCSNLLSFNLASKSDLKALEELEITRSTISGQAIFGIISQATELKNILIENCVSDIREGKDQNSCNLTLLENLKITRSGITGTFLSSILKKAHNLKSLCLSGCNITGSLNLENLESLRMLEYLDLSYSNISHKDLMNILNSAPNLKAINLSNCKNLKGAVLKNLEKFLFLEDINVTRSNIAGSLLGRIIEKSPNLKNINAGSCNNLTSMIFGKLERFRFLKKLNISGSNIPGTELAMIIKHSPILHSNKLLLLNCLETFKEHHPAIAYIATLLGMYHQYSLNKYEMNVLFSSKCTDDRKIKILSMFDQSTQNEVSQNSISLSPILESRIARVLILGKYKDKDPKIPQLENLTSHLILSFINPKKQGIQPIPWVIKFRKELDNEYKGHTDDANKQTTCRTFSKI